MIFLPRDSRRLLTLLCLLPALVGFFGAARVQAQSPDKERPYLELPFPGGRSYEVTCGYGCYQHTGNMKYGVDFALPEGAPVSAAAGGEVMAITWEIGLPRSLDLGDALIVYVDHGGGWFTRYIHLSALTVRVGDRVEMGQIIGYSGKTGASGAHLHFELRRGRLLASPSVPIDELFGAAPPVEGRPYRSNNAPLPTEAVRLPTTVAPTPRTTAVTRALPGPAVAAPPTPAAVAVAAVEPPPAVALPSAPAVAPGYAATTPFVSGGIALSSPVVSAGSPITVTFTLLNPTEERLTLTTLGVMGTERGSTRGMRFTRAVTLEPGQRYTFTRSLTVEEPGPLSLVPFALGAHDEWLPLSGATQPLPVQVLGPTLYIPMLFGPQAPEVPPVPTRGVRDIDK